MVNRLIPARWEWIQEAHCCRTGHLDSVATVQSHDGGGGRYLTLTADEWAFDSEAEIQEFADSLKACLRAACEASGEATDA